jgi:Rieske Fe-S protein
VTLSRRSALKTIGALFLSACDTTILRMRGFKVTPIATLDQVPPGGAYRTKLGDEPIILVNVAGDVRAFVAECTHEGCPLGWNPNQHLIRCPCHGSAFDLTGMPVNGPATKSLAGYPVLVRENQISLVVPPNDRSQAERKVESPR